MGACRIENIEGNAGLAFYKDRNCKDRCDNSSTCTGYTLPVKGANWCETYTSAGIMGNDRREFKCYVKKDGKYIQMKYIQTYTQTIFFKGLYF